MPISLELFDPFTEPVQKNHDVLTEMALEVMHRVRAMPAEELEKAQCFVIKMAQYITRHPIDMALPAIKWLLNNNLNKPEKFDPHRQLYHPLFRDAVYHAWFKANHEYIKANKINPCLRRQP